MKRYGLLLVALFAVAINVNAQGFGGAVAFDGGEILVAETNNRVFAGDVYIFHKADGEWKTKTTLMAPGGGTDGDGFGASIAIHGDHLLVGSPGADGGRGAVYEFSRDGDNWTSSGMLPLPAMEAEGAGRKV
ncbi:MAG: hypothetical protein HKN13_07065, partial [Rhodothermales bacterium]|nr:hypothetical protein [Rhodothermales bacterium]